MLPTTVKCDLGKGKGKGKGEGEGKGKDKFHTLTGHEGQEEKTYFSTFS
jgi:hypothetical protein